VQKCDTVERLTRRQPTVPKPQTYFTTITEAVLSGEGLHNEELYDTHSTPNSIRGIKSKGVRWGGACNTYE
jgi:hypothetical protein